MLDIQLTHYIANTREELQEILKRIYHSLKVFSVVDDMDDFRCLVEDNGYDVFDHYKTKESTYPVIISVIPEHKGNVASICLYPLDKSGNLNKTIFNGASNETSDKKEIINLIYRLIDNHFKVTVNDKPQEKIYDKNELIMLVASYKFPMIMYLSEETNEWKLEYSLNECDVATILLGKTPDCY